MAKEYKTTKFGDYSLVFNNCLDYVQHLLKNGKYTDKDMQMAIHIVNNISPIGYIPALKVAKIAFNPIRVPRTMPRSIPPHTNVLIG